jgi:hypothetical protein
MDEWLDEARIAYSSRVLPIGKSLPDRQRVLPAMQVDRIIGDAGLIALTDCVCRTHYRRCDKPVSVCLLLDEFGQMFIGRKTLNAELTGAQFFRASG